MSQAHQVQPSRLKLLRGLVDEQGQTTIMVTHDPVAASYADRVIFLVDGHITDEMRRPTVQGVAEHMARLEADTAPARVGGGQ
ncbi:hypothetical protein SALBM311S_04960 [Streptomyces alboniger]